MLIRPLAACCSCLSVCSHLCELLCSWRTSRASWPGRASASRPSRALLCLGSLIWKQRHPPSPCTEESARLAASHLLAHPLTMMCLGSQALWLPAASTERRSLCYVHAYRRHHHAESRHGFTMPLRHHRASLPLQLLTLGLELLLRPQVS